MVNLHTNVVSFYRSLNTQIAKASTEKQITDIESVAKNHFEKLSDYKLKRFEGFKKAVKIMTNVNTKLVTTHDDVQKLIQESSLLGDLPKSKRGPDKKYEDLIARQTILNNALKKILKNVNVIRGFAMDALHCYNGAEAALRELSQAAQQARKKLANQIQPQIKQIEFLPANYFGKVSIIDAKDYPEPQKLFMRVQNFSTFCSKELIEDIKNKDHETLLAIENEEIVGLLIGQKRISAVEGSENTVTELCLKSLRCNYSLNSIHVKLMLLLEGIRKTQSLSIEKFNFDYEHSGRTEFEIYSRPNQFLFKRFEDVLKESGTEIHSQMSTETLSTIYENQTRHVSISIPKFNYAQAKKNLEENLKR